MKKRIDYFAMSAMNALVQKDRNDLAMIKAEQETGLDRKTVLAKLAYDIAEAMELEADNH